MNTVNSYFNPFSIQFQESTEDFEKLSTVNKIVAVTAAILGAIISPFILFTGSFALFQLSVKWLKEGDNDKADSVNNVVKKQVPFSNTNNNSKDLVNSQLMDSNEDSSIIDDDRNRSDLDNSSQTMEQAGIKSFHGSIDSNTGTGSGIVLYTDGSTYSGQLKNWKRHGAGTYTRNNGDKYWNFNSKNLNFGDKYWNSAIQVDHFDWVNDELTFGYISINRSLYRGEIRNLLAHGQGILKDHEKKETFEGRFENGSFIEGEKISSLEQIKPI